MSRTSDIDSTVDSSEMNVASMCQLLTFYTAYIGYVPLRHEVTATDFIGVPTDVPYYVIAPRASLDPEHEAAQAMACAGDRPAALFIPGKRYDTLGTRHGQGGGWYDRFLTYVPPAWLRIGFCFDDQFSSEPLPRQSWDQPVDIVCVIDRELQSLTLHKTRAREHDVPTILA